MYILSHTIVQSCSMKDNDELSVLNQHYTLYNLAGYNNYL